MASARQETGPNGGGGIRGATTIPSQAYHDGDALAYGAQGREARPPDADGDERAVPPLPGNKDPIACRLVNVRPLCSAAGPPPARPSLERPRRALLLAVAATRRGAAGHRRRGFGVGASCAQRRGHARSRAVPVVGPRRPTTARPTCRSSSPATLATSRCPSERREPPPDASPGGTGVPWRLPSDGQVARPSARRQQPLARPPAHSRSAPRTRVPAAGLTGSGVSRTATAWAPRKKGRTKTAVRAGWDGAAPTPTARAKGKHDLPTPRLLPLPSPGGCATKNTSAH